jgi:hypothetical protein
MRNDSAAGETLNMSRWSRVSVTGVQWFFHARSSVDSFD